MTAEWWASLLIPLGVAFGLLALLVLAVILGNRKGR